MTNGIPVCIECGGPTNDLNEDESGEACLACSERLLESLPGVFHTPWTYANLGESAEDTGDALPKEDPGDVPEARMDPGPAKTLDDPREPA